MANPNHLAAITRGVASWNIFAKSQRVSWEADLTNVSLANGHLAGADLRGADFRGTDLSGTDLRTARLDGANLGGANLTEADLTDADLTGALLAHADLRRADLSGAHLVGAVFTLAELAEARLQGANLSHARFRGARLVGADLSGARLSNTHLAGAVLIGADLRGAFLDRTELADAVLSRAHLAGVDFSTSLVSGVNFTGAIFEASASLPMPEPNAVRFTVPMPSDAPLDDFLLAVDAVGVLARLAVRVGHRIEHAASDETRSAGDVLLSTAPTPTTFVSISRAHYGSPLILDLLESAAVIAGTGAVARDLLKGPDESSLVNLLLTFCRSDERQDFLRARSLLRRNEVERLEADSTPRGRTDDEPGVVLHLPPRPLSEVSDDIEEVPDLDPLVRVNLLEELPRLAPLMSRGLTADVPVPTSGISEDGPT